MIFELHAILPQEYPTDKTPFDLWNWAINNQYITVTFVDSRKGDIIFQDNFNTVYNQTEIFLMGLEYSGIASEEKYYIDYPNGTIVEVKW